MSITITLSSTVSEAGLARVEELAHQLQARDGNFQGRTISMQRGTATAVTDTDDRLRAALLQLMVDSVLEQHTPPAPQRTFSSTRSMR